MLEIRGMKDILGDFFSIHKKVDLVRSKCLYLLLFLRLGGKENMEKNKSPPHMTW
jgi:hypothetical protein